MRAMLLATILMAPAALAQSAPRPFPDTRGADPDIVCLLTVSNAENTASDDAKRAALNVQIGFFMSRVNAHFPTDAALADAFRKMLTAYGERRAELAAFGPACAQRFVAVTDRMRAGMAAAQPAR